MNVTDEKLEIPVAEKPPQTGDASRILPHDASDHRMEQIIAAILAAGVCSSEEAVTVGRAVTHYQKILELIREDGIDAEPTRSTLNL